MFEMRARDSSITLTRFMGLRTGSFGRVKSSRFCTMAVVLSTSLRIVSRYPLYFAISSAPDCPWSIFLSMSRMYV